MKKLTMLFVALLFMVGMAAQAFAVNTTNNNFTMIDGTGAITGGTNDVAFTWDETMKTSVVSSGQVSNATLASTCPFFGITWSAHDVAIYGPGTYTVYAGCGSGSPGCGTGTPITFTVAAGELGAHMLFNWGASSNIDVVDVLAPNAVFAPSPMQTAGCLTNPASKVWDWMSKDWDGDGKNGKGMVDGPFLGFNANFNLMGKPAVCTTPANLCEDNNVCTNNDWNVNAAGPGECPCLNTANTASCDDGLFCNGSDTCANKTCGHSGNPCTAPLVCNETTNHCDDLCADAATRCNDNNVCTTDTCIATTGNCMHTNNTAACNDNNICTTGDACSGGTCRGSATVPASCNDNNACTTDGCTANACTHVTINCNDNSACTTDTCNTATGCIHTAIVCNDNTACTTDTCNTSTGCVFTSIVCNDNLACTTDSCNTSTGCVFTNTCPSGQICTASGCSSAPCTGNAMCNDNNACTTDTCNTATGACSNTAINCNDNNACTTDTCNTATGCVHTAIVCNDNLACTTDSCNTATGCVFTNTCPSGQSCTASGCSSAPCTGNAMCNDNNACTTDTCNTATGVCSNTAINCNDNNACTTDTCNTATGCVHTTIVCNDNNACTTDTCNTATGCVHTAVVCNDNNLCTTDTCNTATGCVFTPVTCPTGQSCNTATGTCVAVNLCTGVVCNDNNACTTDTCNTATGTCVFTPIVCNDNNACTTNTCNTATGCVYTPIPGCGVTGSDAGIIAFRVTSEIKNCNRTVPIIIVAKNFGDNKVIGTITLYKDGEAVKTWSNVKFYKHSVVTRVYLYKPAGDGGKTINWYAVVDVPNDPNLSNNTSMVKTTVVDECKTVKHHWNKDRHDNRDHDGHNEGH